MNLKAVKRSRRKYDAEFKKEVLKMIESGRAVPDVAQSLGVGTNLIYNWIKQLKKKITSTKDGMDISFEMKNRSFTNG